MIKSHTGRLTVPVEERDHALGSASALVTMVEYGDYECPYCGRAHQVVKQLLTQLGHQVRFVYRHFPLASAHPHAQQAAEAAEAAGVQRAFWETDSTSKFDISIQLRDIDPSLRPGLTAQIVVLGAKNANTLYVPRLAISAGSMKTAA